MSAQLHPLTFQPVYRDYPWGGRRLAGVYGRPLPPGVWAESWEISDRTDGMSVVDRGPWAGRSLRELVTWLGPQLIGAAAPAGPFPLLLKVIDAARRTSLQVHPDERAALRLGGEPKTEIWYALREMNEGGVFAGLQPGVDRAGFERALHRGGLEPILRRVALPAGAAVLIPGGRVHAIDAGCFLLEIQQNSDTTWRVFDWGHTRPDGTVREMHLAPALDAIRWDDAAAEVVRPRLEWSHDRSARWRVLASDPFRVDKLRLGEELARENDGRSFHALFVESGQVRVSGGGLTIDLARGSSALLPAGLPEYTLCPAAEPGDGTAEVIVTTLG